MLRRSTSTAMLVAAAALLDTATDAEERLAAALARVCLEECEAPGRRLLRLLDLGAGRALLRGAQAFALPGIAAHYRWRKRRIRGWVQAHTDAGARQLIVLGAGFDALAAGLVRSVAQLQAIEIDLPAQQRIKRRALARLGLEHPRMALVAADLASRSPAVALTGASGFDRDAPSIVLAEGLLMYLPPPAVPKLFEGVAAALATPAVVVATAMDQGADGVPGFHRQHAWVRRWLRQRGESFQWGCGRAALPEAMRASGLRIEEIADPELAPDPDPCPGEWLFRATLAGRAGARHPGEGTHVEERWPSPARLSRAACGTAGSPPSSSAR